ncbi:hypothetical protein MKZ38_001675 [Zalerion maritima]|uniref:Extracellular membrane protein CFEM domain-containing protein n=1 Tax=Zalerion maritima TaxID=339359 RepID=A0AAD5WRA7_9PEZI|nr:hypothetical protein MKZ38_001675 [Zalerion maritima]
MKLAHFRIGPHLWVAFIILTALSRADEQEAGSSCSEEGQWNCMTNSWQRCAAAVWSVTMPCADGTTCSPSGLTYDFAVNGDDDVSGSSTATTSGASSVSTSSDARKVKAVLFGVGGMLVLFWGLLA